MFRQHIRTKILSVGSTNNLPIHDKGTTEFTADTVGGKKRKQSFDVKKEKKNAKKQVTESDVSPVCSSCSQRGHKSSRSHECRNHRPTKDEVFFSNLGAAHTAYTRKVSLESVVRPEYAALLQSRIIEASQYIRRVIFGCQLFVNHYCIAHERAPPGVFKQNFWYTISQLVMNKRPTSNALMPADMMASWDCFRASNPQARVTQAMPTGVSNCFTEVCKDLATQYTNNLVENFEVLVKKYLFFKVQNTFVLLQRKDVSLVVDQYCYPLVGKGKPTWPKRAFVTDSFKKEVLSVCEPLVSLVPEPASLKNLSARPSGFFPCLHHIARSIEDEIVNHQMDVRRVPPPKRVTLLSSASLAWRTIPLNPQVLATFSRSKCPRGYQEELELFLQVFDFRRLKIEGVDALRPNGNNKFLFGNHASSDGTSLNLLFHKRKMSAEDQSVKNHKLTIHNFTLEEVKRDYQVFCVDPGRKSLFTAVSPSDFDELDSVQVRRMSTNEYHHFLDGGLQQKLAHWKTETNVQLIESTMPTPKTTSTSMLDQYATHILPHWDEFENFNNLRMSHFRLQHYKGKQRGKEIATNYMTHGAKKYDRAQRKRSAARGERRSVGLPKPVLTKRKWKPQKFQHDPAKVPLILFGEATLGRDHVPIKGLRVGSTNVLYENLKRREMAGDLIVILVDEYLTSQVCSSCSDRDLIKMPGVRGFSVLKCRNCHRKWQRDVNAARNIMKIAYSVWAGNGVPRAFQRRPRPN